MFRNLMDRVKLQVHRDQKEMERYSLAVGKGVPKLKPHVETPEPDTPQSFGSKTHAPIRWFRARNGDDEGRARMKYPDSDVHMIAGILALQLAVPVHDDTVLTGKFDFQLFWARAGKTWTTAGRIWPPPFRSSLD